MQALHQMSAWMTAHAWKLEQQFLLETSAGKHACTSAEYGHHHCLSSGGSHCLQGGRLEKLQMQRLLPMLGQQQRWVLSQPPPPLPLLGHPQGFLPLARYPAGSLRH